MKQDNQRQNAEILNEDPYYQRDSFSRIDDSNDREFYAKDRFVQHLDETALSTIKHIIGQLVVEHRPWILDLMAGWDSHVPATISPANMVGLGLNYRELSRNEMCNAYVIHDLNEYPELSLDSRTFDVVLNTVSVDYMTRPFEVFAEVARILKPGGLFLVTFSNRMFETKATKIWRESSEEERVILVEDLFDQTKLFTKPEIFVSKNRPRPVDDKYTHLGLPSDPVYMVYAERKGGGFSFRPRILNEPHDAPLAVSIREKMATVGQTKNCPHCDAGLCKWEVPSNPFIEWDSEYMYICFNDQCPYFQRGWNAMYRGGGRGFSHRFMYDSDHDRCLSVPVPTSRALKDGIIE